LTDAPNKIESWKLPEPWRPDHPVFAFHEDTNANAVLITKSGEIFAVAEERLSRNRFQAGFPRRALAWIEKASGVKLETAPTLVFGNRTHFLPRVLGSFFPSFEHDMFGLTHKLMLMYHHLCYLSPGFSGMIEQVNRFLLWLRFRRKIVLVDHHYAHAASAYFTSGKESACAVSADNYGDGFAARVFDCEGGKLHYRRGVSALNSPGQFYGEIAQIAGIHPLLAGKLTGMAAWGEPSHKDKMQAIFDVTPDKRGFTSTFGWGRSKAKPPFAELGEVPTHDLAASAQKQFEDAIVAFTREAAIETGKRDLVLAGGSFANVRVNQRLLELPEIDSVFIHPGMTDQGIAMGAALAYLAGQKGGMPFHMENLFLGPEPTEAEIKAVLDAEGLSYERPEDIEITAAKLLAEGNLLARFSGPMEYGLRALGNRSILYQTQDPNLQKQLNERLARAEYMPFAPMVMEEHASRCFIDVDKALEAGRFMTISYHSTDWMKENCPGVVHQDGTVRPQILRQSDNPAMYKILDAYREITGLPCLLNTSFNLHSEPIVGSPIDAVKAFRKARLDFLIAGPFLVHA
jgi:carbamoyltransferase